MSELGDMRRDFHPAGLDRSELLVDPLAQFRKWLDQAIAADIMDPTAMTLATADGSGRPSARIVLLKDLDERGLCFYTDYQSHKAHDLAANPCAALVFYWPQMDRQIRFEGSVKKVSRQRSEAYFMSRPLGSQISATASAQSQPVASRQQLHAMAQQVASQAQQHPLSLPDDWGGYRLIPDMVEFWVGQPSRLHDRFAYTRQADGSWMIQRLCP
jgi:pyridoxamine 5'-phosphate oxidase